MTTLVTRYFFVFPAIHAFPALDVRERYGYDLVKTLVNVPGLGVTEGTVYPLLSRLHAQDLVTTRLEESTDGPVRKYYSLTPRGKKIVVVMNTHLETLVTGSRKLRSMEKTHE